MIVCCSDSCCLRWKSLRWFSSCINHLCLCSLYFFSKTCGSFNSNYVPLRWTLNKLDILQYGTPKWLTSKVPLIESTYVLCYFVIKPSVLWKPQGFHFGWITRRYEDLNRRKLCLSKQVWVKKHYYRVWKSLQNQLLDPRFITFNLEILKWQKRNWNKIQVFLTKYSTT